MGLTDDIAKAASNATKGLGDIAAATGKGITDAASVAKEAADGAANAVKSTLPGNENSPINEMQVKELLDLCYEKALDGVPNISKSVDELVDDYLSKYDDVNDAARSLINMQLIKNTTSGALSTTKRTVNPTQAYELATSQFICLTSSKNAKSYKTSQSFEAECISRIPSSCKQISSNGTFKSSALTLI